MNTEKKSGKKALIIAALVLAAIVAAVGTYVIYTNHQEKLRTYRNIADDLLYREYILSSSRDDMLRGEGYRGTRYMEIKDQEEFRKILAEQFQLMLDEGKAEGAGMDGFTAWVGEVVALLDKQGIQDETIRAAYQAFMAGKQEELSAPDVKNYTIYPFFRGIRAASASAFYSEGVMSEEDAADFLRGRVAAILEEKNFEDLSEDLEMLAETGWLELCYPEPGELVDTLLEHCEVYAAAPGNGGYYDGMKDVSSSRSSGLDPAGMGSSIGTRSSSSSDKYYGDFHYHSYSSKTQYDGLVDQASKDKYNSSKSGQSLSFRDMEVDGSPSSFQWAAGNGAQFAICGRYHDADANGSGLRCVALFSNRQLYIPGKYLGAGQSMGCYTVDGGFQDQIQEARAAYREKYSVPAGDSQGAAH